MNEEFNHPTPPLPALKKQILACHWCNSEVTLDNATEHWRYCEKHPARIAIAKLEAEVERWKFDADTTRQAHITTHARMAELEKVAMEAIETLSAGRHLLNKYCPEHKWLPEHDQRIERLQATIRDGGKGEAGKR